MKNIVLILSLFFMSINTQCQDVNILGNKDYNNIKINKVTLISITSTNGNKKQLQNLFSIRIKKTTTDEDYVDYEFDGFDIGFSAKVIRGGVISGKIISGFEMTNKNWNITIKGKTVTIGDNIRKLGNVVFNKKRNGNKGIIYKSCEDCNNYIGIDFDQKTKKITRIYYIEMT